MQAQFGVSGRRACAVVGQARATERTRFGRYGYRRVTALLRREGWQVNH